MAFDAAVAGVTLAGSLLSAVTSCCVLACFVFFNSNQRSFRHALVFNLTLSDFINATNNSISGIIYVHDKELEACPACAFNGWLGQLSVQATDFSILAISVATLLVVTQTGRVTNASTLTKVALCLSVWVVPLITSTTALGMGVMVPVSGNWCWISAARTDLRYALGHGWRFAIMGITVVIYIYIYWWITRHFKSLRGISMGSTHYTAPGNEEPPKSSSFSMPLWKKKKNEPCSEFDDSIELTRNGNERNEFDDLEQDPHDWNPAAHQAGITATTTTTVTSASNPDKVPLPPSTTATANHSRSESTATAANTEDIAAEANQNINSQLRARSQKVERDIKRMLLLNGYPICYVILWIPGITNRLMEATGHTSNSRALAILQASTQFIGFANAVTYGLNQQWRGR